MNPRNQLADFGRRAAPAPLNRCGPQPFYLHGGQFYSVADSPATHP